MSLDFPKDTWVFQQVFNEGKEEGRREGMQKALKGLLASFVKLKFPTLLTQAKQIVEQKVSVEQLETMLNKLYRANTIEEAQAALLAK